MLLLVDGGHTGGHGCWQGFGCRRVFVFVMGTVRCLTEKRGDVFRMERLDGWWSLILYDGYRY